jgi:hypothetical protein
VTRLHKSTITSALEIEDPLSQPQLLEQQLALPNSFLLQLILATLLLLLSWLGRQVAHEVGEHLVKGSVLGRFEKGDCPFGKATVDAGSFPCLLIEVQVVFNASSALSDLFLLPIPQLPELPHLLLLISKHDVCTMVQLLNGVIEIPLAGQLPQYFGGQLSWGGRRVFVGDILSHFLLAVVEQFLVESLLHCSLVEVGVDCLDFLDKATFMSKRLAHSLSTSIIIAIINDERGRGPICRRRRRDRGRDSYPGATRSFGAQVAL